MLKIELGVRGGRGRGGAATTVGKGRSPTGTHKEIILCLNLRKKGVFRMASRTTVKQQGADEAVVKGGKQRCAAKGRNRKALGDIGNLANVGELEVKPNRPITRSFRALLHAQAQAAAAAPAATDKNNKKQVSANVAGLPPVSNAVAAAKRVVKKRGQKKVTVKPKPEKPIEKEAIPDKKNRKNKTREGDDNCKKNSHAFTSVLTARSKAASGITNKPKEQIIDIDAGDVDNELAAVEYIDGLYRLKVLSALQLTLMNRYWPWR